MAAEDDAPLKKPEIVLGKLDTLSVVGLNGYIAELEAEILRAREEIKKRGSARANAEAVFGKKSL